MIRFGRITRRHIEIIKEITRLTNRGMYKSSSIYREVKNKTLAAINMTVAMRAIPLVSNKSLKFIGLEGVV